MLHHLRRRLGLPNGAAAPIVPHAAVSVPVPMPDAKAPPPETTLEALWSEGFSGPGRAVPVLALAQLLRLPAGAPVLLLGAAMGGPALALAAAGHRVSAYEADPGACARAKCLGARACVPIEIGQWDPVHPDFGLASHDHAILLDALSGADPAIALPAVIAALRPGGQIAMRASVADRPLPDDPALPSEMAVTRVFLRLGCEILDSADISRETVTQALAQWTETVRGMERGTAAARRTEMLAEAERWLRRVELLQTGQVRMVRWHVACLTRAPERRS